MIDTHCHLDWHAFNSDRDAVVARARESGVTRMLTIGVDAPSSEAAVALAGRYAGVFAAVGVHPNDSAGLDDDALQALRHLAAGPRVRAIGEIGLDYYWKKVAPEQQAHALRAQLALAAELGLPVVIHNRDATGDTLAFLGEWVDGLRAAGHPLAAHPGVLHSFSSDWPAAQRALALGFYLGVSGPVTYKSAATLRAVVAAAPAERLLIETDAPFLTPHPHRGERNEPAHVRFVAEGVAAARDETVDLVLRQTDENAERLFRFGAET